MAVQLQELLGSRAVVGDGAWGTQMQERGLPAGMCPDSWNLEQPEQVEQVARAYVDAGSQIILTNTFRSNPISLAGYGLALRAGEINRAGAEISRRAADGRALVVGSMGPSGRLISMGEVSEQDLREAFLLQAHALAEGGVHGIVVETVADLEEALIAVRASRETGLPVIASMVFDSGKQKDRTMMGIRPEQAAEALEQAGAAAIGANCGLGIAGLVPICRRLRAASSLPIWIKPNAGMPLLENGRPVYSTTPEEFAEHALQLVEAGANVVGGCCGTTPAFVSALTRSLA